ncbi:hypothetical protein ACHAWF_003859 [Thalassiosira exigua]
MEPATPFGVGILGCARIAKKNCRAAKAASCEITALASRSKEKADGFVKKVLGGDDPIIFAGGDAYDQMLDSDLRSVYIPLPTKLHEPYVARALASKHVLLEKPVATSAGSYREMLRAASQNRKFLMDGTMFVHHPRTRQFVKSVPRDPNRVNFNFTFDATAGSNFFQNDIRTKKDADFMGCVGDLGWYCVRMGLLVFSALDAGALRGMVTDVQCTRYQLNEDGVPYDADCLVHLTENRVLSFHCSFIHAFNQTCHVFGTGTPYVATMNDVVLPLRGDTLSFSLVEQAMFKWGEIITEESKGMDHDNSKVQEVFMWENFSNWAKAIEEESSSGSTMIDVDNEIWWGGESDEVKEANAMASYSLHTQLVLDALMESINRGGAKVQIKN